MARKQDHNHRDKIITALIIIAILSFFLLAMYPILHLKSSSFSIISDVFSGWVGSTTAPVAYGPSAPAANSISSPVYGK